MADLQQNELLQVVALDARDALSLIAERIDHRSGATDAAVLLAEVRATAGLHARRLRIALRVPVATVSPVIAARTSVMFQ
jgi:hypothetical protein